MGRIVVDDPAALQTLAERIDTGAGDPKRVRALVVFNVGDTPATGVAVLSVDMPWPPDRPLPPVGVRSTNGLVPSGVRGVVYDGGARRIQFELAFRVTDIPSRGWSTYWAEYGASAGLGCSEPVHRNLRVAETLCHCGALPGTSDGQPTP